MTKMGLQKSKNAECVQRLCKIFFRCLLIFLTIKRSVEAIPGSFQILIGLLLCCCFHAVFSIKTASQQQPGKKEVATSCLKSGADARKKSQNKKHRGSVHTLHFSFFVTTYL